MSRSYLIAEIGASSSRWALVDEEGKVDVLPAAGERMPGYNPVSGNAQAFATGIAAHFADRRPEALEAAELVVYGAGCGTPERAASMAAALRPVWPAARIEVYNDLLGAARGLCGNEPSLVLVLGTGMNAGWFDGDRLHQPMPSLGYVLGDEGSGADIGRTLLQDVFYQRMPEAVRMMLFGPDGPVLSQVIDEVYRSPFPSRSLAAYTGLLARMPDEPYVRELVTARFHALLEILTPFFPMEQRSRVVATGSVAWGFQDILAACLLDHGMELATVERDPLAGLVRWHQGR